MVLALVVPACATEEPPSSPLDIRTPSQEEGRISGQVRSGSAGTIPMPGTVVELGRWRGSSDELQDLIRKQGGSGKPEDPRFRVIARAVVDDSGAYQFREVPRWQIFGLRARPPAGTPFRVTYLDSLFSLGAGRDRWKWFRIVLQPMSSTP